MSSDIVMATETIQQIAEKLDKAFEEQDTATIAAHLHDAFRLQHHGPSDVLPFFGEFDKETYFTGFLKGLGEAFEPTKFELKDRFAHGDKVCEELKWTVIARNTGKILETPLFSVSRYENGKLIEMEIFTDSYAVVQAAKSP